MYGWVSGPQEIDKKTMTVGLSKDYATGVLFSTYSSLISEGGLPYLSFQVVHTTQYIRSRMVLI